MRRTSASTSYSRATASRERQALSGTREEHRRKRRGGTTVRSARALCDVITAATRRAGDEGVTADEPEAHLVGGLPEHGLVVVGTRVRKASTTPPLGTERASDAVSCGAVTRCSCTTGNWSRRGTRATTTQDEQDNGAQARVRSDPGMRDVRTRWLDDISRDRRGVPRVLDDPGPRTVEADCQDDAPGRGSRCP